jgi:hypothetical protein
MTTMDAIDNIAAKLRADIAGEKPAEKPVKKPSKKDKKEAKVEPAQPQPAVVVDAKSCAGCKLNTVSGCVSKAKFGDDNCKKLRRTK